MRTILPQQLHTKSFFALLLLIFQYNPFCLAQEDAVIFPASEIDFGKIASGANPPIPLNFVNNTGGKLAILLIEKPSNINVNFPHIFYLPGEKGSIAIQYNPSATGPFKETINVYTNLSSQPSPITLKGEAVSILECFPDPNNLTKRLVKVINKQTGDAIPHAELSLVHNHKYKSPFVFKVNKEGIAEKDIPIGMYQITSKVHGFEEYLDERFIPKSQPYVLIELTPVKPTPLLPIAVIPPDQEAVHNNTPLETPAKSSFLPEDRYAANNLIFLLDVSTSMKSGGKFTLLQQAVNNLVMILRPIDNISIITYSNETNLALEGASGEDKDKIIGVVQELNPYGITRGVKGLNSAYELATKNFIAQGNNQIILMTDGEFSEQGVSDEYYQSLIAGHRASGIILSIIGFGINKDAIKRMELMSNSGDGSFILVNSEDITHDILIDEVKAKSFLKK